MKALLRTVIAVATIYLSGLTVWLLGGWASTWFRLSSDDWVPGGPTERIASAGVLLFLLFVVYVIVFSLANTDWVYRLVDRLECRFRRPPDLSDLKKRLEKR